MTERDEPYTDGLDEEEAFIATSFIEFHTEHPASGEWIPMAEEEARARWDAWLTAHDEAVRAEEREKAAQIAKSNLGRRWVGGGTPADIAAAIREQGKEQDR